MKKLLSMLLIMSMLLNIAGLGVFAEEEEEIISVDEPIMEEETSAEELIEITEEEEVPSEPTGEETAADDTALLTSDTMEDGTVVLTAAAGTCYWQRLNMDLYGELSDEEQEAYWETIEAEGNILNVSAESVSYAYRVVIETEQGLKVSDPVTVEAKAPEAAETKGSATYLLLSVADGKSTIKIPAGYLEVMEDFETYYDWYSESTWKRIMRVSVDDGSYLTTSQKKIYFKSQLNDSYNITTINGVTVYYNNTMTTLGIFMYDVGTEYTVTIIVEHTSAGVGLMNYIENSIHVHTSGSAEREHVVDSTCSQTGSYDLVFYCTDCGMEVSRTKMTIAKKAHTSGTAVRENVVASTCTTDGSYDSVVYCKVCGTEISRTEMTIAAAHKPSAAVEENRVESTCTATGSYDTVVYCSVCKNELSRETKTIQMKPHAYTIPGRVLRQPTDLEAGEQLYTCANCESTTTVEVYHTFDLAASKNAAQTMNLNTKLQLTAEYAENSGLTVTGWTTSSAKVATVSASGVVSGIAEGSATITATLSNKKKTTVKITVADPKKLTAVALNVNAAETLYLGNTLTLIPTVTPSTAEPTITWATSSAKVATVKDGIVTPVAAGKANITVTATYGKVKKTAKVAVTVVDPAALTGVTLNANATETLYLGDTLTLTAQPVPSTAEAAITWTTSSAKVATVENGVVTPVAAGKATITATAVSGKIKKTAKVTVTVADPATLTGVALNASAAETLYLGDTLTLTAEPVPSGAEATIIWATSSAKVATVEDGVVTPVAEGKATITVTAVSGKIKKTAKVAVTVADPKKPTAVTLDAGAQAVTYLGSYLS